MLAVAAVACGEPNWIYAPVRTTSAEVDGASASVHFGQPGEVRVSTLGVTTLAPEGTNLSTRAVLIRIAVTNKTAQPWTLDGTEQRLEASGRTFHASNAELGAPPTVQIPPGVSRSIDLYFPLPPAFKLGAFDVVWTLDGPGVARTDRTTFERFLNAPEQPEH